jgi:YbgC/YbaW family acyl-CoA thioester hydrolase
VSQPEPRVPPSVALRFRARLHTRWADEDNHGVLNNAVYLTLFEEGRHAYFSHLSLLDQNRFPFVLRQTNVRYLSPGRGGEDVTLELGTTELGRSSFTQAYRLLDDHAVVWAEAEGVCVFVDPTSGRPCPIPPAVRARIAEFEGLGGRDHGGGH